MNDLIIHLCINDRNGNELDYITCLEIARSPQDHVLRLEAWEGDDAEGPSFTLTRDTLTIVDRSYPIVQDKRGTHVGNIHWDCVWMAEADADRLALDCLEDGWSPEEWYEGWGLEEIRERVQDRERQAEAAKFQTVLFEEEAA